jgi:cell wall assembly regulator SMI1
VLLDAGADIHTRAIDSDGEKDGPNALDMAADRGCLPIVKLLMARGADVNSKNSADVTPLTHAARDKKPAHEAVMKALLAAGAKPNYQALVSAATWGSPAMIDMLVAAGADVQEISRHGTALLRAAYSKRDDTAAALLRAGADPALRIPDSHRKEAGKTAMDAAKKEKAKKVIALLEAALKGAAVPAAVPKAPADVTALWKQIEKALKSTSPGVKKSLNKGATRQQIASSEKKLGVELPAPLRESYLLHDGQKERADGLFPEGFADLPSEFVLLSLEEAAADWNNWTSLAKSGEFKGSVGQPDKGVKPDWWNRKWIPFASDGGGDSLCVDLAPAKAGTAGQIIGVQHDSASRDNIEPGGFQAFLSRLAEHLESSAE